MAPPPASLKRWHAALSKLPRAALTGESRRGQLFLDAYLGDKLLGLAIKRAQLARRPAAEEIGRLTSTYSYACSNKLLAEHLSSIIPEPALAPLGSLSRREAATEVEAAVAAIEATEGGAEAIRDLAAWLLAKAENVDHLNPKGALLEAGGSFGDTRPLQGFPDHAPKFRTTAHFHGDTATAEGPNVLAAEEEAARVLLRRFATRTAAGGGASSEGPPRSSAPQPRQHNGRPPDPPGPGSGQDGDGDAWVSMVASPSASDADDDDGGDGGGGGGEGWRHREAFAEARKHPDAAFRNVCAAAAALNFTVSAWVKRSPPMALLALNAPPDPATGAPRVESIIRCARSNDAALNAAALQALDFAEALLPADVATCASMDHEPAWT